MSSDDRSSDEDTGRQSSEEPVPENAKGEAEKREELEEALSLEVTMRRRAEDKLSQTEERLQLMIAGAEDYAFFLVDTEGRIMTWNVGARKLFGHSNDEAIDQPFEMIFTPEDREAGIPERELRKALDKGAADDDRWHIRKDGTKFWAHGVTTALRNEGVRGFAKLVRDLSSQKQAEEELRESEARYRQQAEELAETNRQKDRFLAVLSHELRNPLAPIRMAAELICDHAEDATLREACSILQRQVETMVRLIDDLLEASRVTSGKVRLQKEVLDIREIAQRAVDSTRSAIETKQQELVVSLPEQALRLQADPIRLEQVIVNLLTNANKYTPEGGKIWLAAEQEQNKAVVRVRDNGEGIPSETLPTLFTLFAQADRSLGSSKGGMGIGMALVRSLVEMHGGTVEAHSEGLGKGSEFVVRLPLVFEQVQVASAAPDAPSHKRSLRVLIVDNSTDAAGLLAMLLRARGDEVRTENSGAAGLETAKQYRPHAVILDIAMPGMDGYELANRIRNDPELKDVPLIAITGHAQNIHRKQSEDAGIDHHLVKPVISATLVKLLDEIKPASD